MPASVDPAWLTSLHSLRRRVRDRAGIIVLGPLILFVCLLVIMVVGGKLLYPAPRGLYLNVARPELHYAADSADVYSSGRLVRQLQRGDSVWVVRLENGSWVVFADRGGHEVVGIGVGLLEPRRPTSPTGSRG